MYVAIGLGPTPQYSSYLDVDFSMSLNKVWSGWKECVRIVGRLPSGPNIRIPIQGRATATGYPKYPEQGLKALVRGSQRALMTTVTCLTQTLEVTVALNIYYPQYAGHVACT